MRDHALILVTLGPDATGEFEMIDGKFNVLFLCKGNSARSIMAESILRENGAERFNAFSAGSQPTGFVHPLTLKTLAANKCPTDNLISKRWDIYADANAPVMDFVFTVCDVTLRDAAPPFPGSPVFIFWGIDDPTLAEGTEIERERAFNDAFRYLRNRIIAFISLPLSKIDDLTKTRLHEIGHMDGSSTPRH